MCGIGGAQASGDSEIDPQIAPQLLRALQHRGPDQAASTAAAQILLVNTRLAIVDPVGGVQPFRGPAGLSAVANGEIYNDPDLRASQGAYAFKTHSDCETVMPCYLQRGTDFASELRGMYAVAISDERSRRLTLSRDPFGIKPLYYTNQGDLLAFASEAGALLDSGLATRSVDAAARSELLQRKFTIGDRTIFPGVKRVLPGETLAVHDGRVAERSQVGPRPPAVAERRPNESEGARTARLLREFEAVMTDSVAVHLRSDVALGQFFSGGVDSSILLHLTRRLSSIPPLALTIGFEGAESVDESRAALALAKAAGVACERVEMGERTFWRMAARAAAAIDDPTTDPAVLPTYVLGQAAAERGLKVVLSGEGADEIFGGYSRYRRAFRPRLSRRASQRGVFSRAGLSASTLEGMNAAMAWPQHGAPGYARVRSLMAFDMAERLPNSLLIKLDRCLMAHSVEGRTPFLDRKVVDFASGLRDRDKINWRTGKRLLKTWLREIAPESQPFARKRGFSVPLASWMSVRRDQLRRLVAEQPGVAEFLSSEEVEAVFDRLHLDAQPAWSLLFYALWHSRHILDVDPDGAIDDVLHEAARRG